MIEMS